MSYFSIDNAIKSMSYASDMLKLKLCLFISVFTYDSNRNQNKPGWV